MKIENLNDIQILIGQNSSENWQLLDDNPSYYWFHLKSFPSCHIVVKTEDIDKETINYAAGLCKNNTKYKNLRNVKVNYTPISNILKAEKEGSVYFKSNRKVKDVTI